MISSSECIAVTIVLPQFLTSQKQLKRSHNKPMCPKQLYIIACSSLYLLSIKITLTSLLTCLKIYIIIDAVLYFGKLATSISFSNVLTAPSKEEFLGNFVFDGNIVLKSFQSS